MSPDPSPDTATRPRTAGDGGPLGGYQVEVTRFAIRLHSAAGGPTFTFNGTQWHSGLGVSRDAIEARLGVWPGFLDGLEAAFHDLREQRQRDEDRHEQRTAELRVLESRLYAAHREALDEALRETRQGRHPLLELWRTRTPEPTVTVPPALAAVRHVKRLPPSSHPCHVYFLLFEGEVVYVGQTAGAWPARIEDHVKEGVKAFDDVWFLEVDRASLLAVESSYIEQFRPRYNRTIRGAL